MSRDFDVDFRERDGFLVGRAAAIQEWSFRKEREADRKLFARLYARNWARLERQRNPEAVRARLRDWRARNPEKVAAATRRRLAKLGKGPRYIKCVVCLALHRVRAIVTAPGRETKFCSKRCANRYHGVPRARARNRGIRHMGLERQVLDFVRAHPGSTLHDVAAGITGAKRGSVATLLCVLVKSGRLVKTPMRGPHVPGRYTVLGGGQ